ncbi:MAG: rod shape-determining protein MreD [Caldicoprobacter oshimai]|uniref:Rod shape-determining protein MreD n=1 Tax=Caldicoprobacter faecalis TaxID=937334 RepID=A0A1I5TW47_9FIRM|nr:rod shape-determining protein MreD [Caldicoprobacter faecalis]PZN11530.1 MAG: rod shape-determining protein MreD [Caldicoprobacter oshimai]SFP87273.1 rod shape-determining protein MreD [Caldicoprobacter faecalis]
MKVWVIAGILLGNLIVQSSLFPFIEVYGVRPDSLMVLVISFALLTGNPTSAVVGLCGGLLQDILFGQNIGFYALQYMLIGYLVGLIYGKVFAGKSLIHVFFVGVATIFRGLFAFLWMYFAGMDVSFQRLFLKVVLPEMVYSMAITPVVYYYMNKLYKYKFMNRRWHFD